VRRHGHDHEDPDDLVRPAPEILEDGIPATEELTEEQLLTLELVEGPIPPIDRPLALDEWGVTPAEERAGLSLDRWLDLEEPDDTRPRVVDRIRQTFQPGADDSLIDVEGAEVALLDDSLGDTLSPEEAAIRIEEQPGGLTYDEGPGYLEDD
jgi:hypothetical protein